MTSLIRISLSNVLETLPLAWNEETRAIFGTSDIKVDPNSHPITGQCVVSSLLIQKHFGGNLMRCRVTTTSPADTVHYFNEIKGMWIDSTRGQFKDLAEYRDIQRNPAPDLYITGTTWERVRLLEKRVLEVINAPYHFSW